VYCFGVDGIGGFSSQRTVESYIAALPQAAGKAYFSLPTIAEAQR